MPSAIMRLRAKGPYACFTRPELKVERVSYPVITPSAARGLFEAVVWKPAISWHIHRIVVEREIKFISVRRNEVNSKVSIPSVATIENGGQIRQYYIEDDHTQRNTVALSDVQYVIDASFTLTGQAGAGDNISKFVDMFQRRLEKGQYFHHPYFGCREFTADVMPVIETLKPIEDNRDLGLMMLDIDYGDEKFRPVFFRACLQNGILEVPAMLMQQGRAKGGVS